MISIRKENEEVLYPATDDVVVVSAPDLDELKRLALLNHRQRVRLCSHGDPSDALHEMFIVHTRECYVRPHMHLNKSESMQILEGEADLVLFHEDGSIRRVISMGAPHSGKPFYQRIGEATPHALIVNTDFLVFYECTQGPFVRSNTVFPDWAPLESEESSTKLIDQLKQRISLERMSHERSTSET